MSAQAWFWKYGYFVVPLIIALVWFLNSEKFQQGDNINPEIFSVFEQIDQQCESEKFNQQSAACIKIQNYRKDCLKISSSCDSKSHYALLQQLGYELPTYYLSPQ